MLRAEKTSFAKLMVTPTAQNLIRVFFLREQMKKLAGGGNKIEHVHVIGAGAMGGDIAAWCAGQDMRVTLGRHEGRSRSPARSSARRICSARSCASAPTCAMRWTG